MPMDPKDKANWIAALKSGKYTQGRTGLCNKTDNTFCCLGVYAEERGIIAIEVADSNYLIYDFAPYGKASTIALTDEFAIHNGIDIDQMGTVIGMNDSGKTFDEIAIYIDEHF